MGKTTFNVITIGILGCIIGFFWYSVMGIPITLIVKYVPFIMGEEKVYTDICLSRQKYSIMTNVAIDEEYMNMESLIQKCDSIENKINYISVALFGGLLIGIFEYFKEKDKNKINS